MGVHSRQLLHGGRRLPRPAHGSHPRRRDRAACGLAWAAWHTQDHDELIREEAKQSAGQALSRLLNLTDGLLGQGRQVLVAITTNENLYRGCIPRSYGLGAARRRSRSGRCPPRKQPPGLNGRTEWPQPPRSRNCTHSGTTAAQPGRPFPGQARASTSEPVHILWLMVPDLQSSRRWEWQAGRDGRRRWSGPRIGSRGT